MKPVRLALCGLGGIGGHHRKLILQNERYELVAAAERFQEAQAGPVQELKDRGLRVYWHLWDLLDDLQDEVEAVVLAVPHHFHSEYTLGCLERGLHVFVEKPVTVLIQDAYRELELAKEKQRLVAVDFQYTGFPHSQALKKFIMEGSLGELQTVVGVMAWKRTDEYYQRAHWAGKRYVEGKPCFDGVLMNQAVHTINSALQMGTRLDDHATVQQVQAETYTVHDGIEMEDLACLRAQLDEATLYLYATTCNFDQPERTTLEITGSKGTASWDMKSATVKLNSGEEIVFDQKAEGEQMHNNFIDCIRGTAPRLYAPLERGMKATLAINGVYTSSGKIHKIGWDKMAQIRELIDQAAAEKKLFSELGADWACPGTPVDMTDYREFVDPQAIAAAGDAAAVPPSGI
jgi:predicted dehydrogenase